MKRIDTDAVQEFETRHIQTVRALAPEGVVLLKNEGILPLQEAGKLVLAGEGAQKTIKGGTGSGDVNVRHFVTIEEGLVNAGFTLVPRETKEADTALYVLSRVSGEGADRTLEGDIDLTEEEIREILALNQSYEKFVLILNVGGMVNLRPVREVKSILLLGQLGTPVGDVCADLLLGKSYPSGKLTMTWAPLADYSSTKNFGDMNDTRYTEGIYVGYRYFDTVGKQPDYAFGFGLSYTEFSYRVTEFAVDGQWIAVTVSVKNTGTRNGKEVLQCYYSAPSKKLDRPYQALAAFAKTGELAPGQEQTLNLSFAIADMAGWDEEKASYLLEAGDYVIRVGNASDCNTACGVIRLCEDAISFVGKNICPGCDFTDEVFAQQKREESTANLAVIEIGADQICTKKAVYRGAPTQMEKTEPVDWQAVKLESSKNFQAPSWHSQLAPLATPCGRDIKTKTVDAFVAGLTKEQLALLCVGNDKQTDGQTVVGDSGTLVAGSAGETTRHLETLHLDRISMADGPAGLRLQKTYRQPGDAGETTYYQYCTAIPIGTALAQSFNIALCEQCGDLVGEEMEQFNVDIWLAPALNIMRSPLCGRNFEYLSEDPVVSGQIAAAIVRGVQKHSGCSATIKHFAANNQETNRYNSNSMMSERTLREIYLKGFEICLRESRPDALMTSYNLINGEHTCSSKDLLTYVLADEWGYDGLVMTDWFVTTTLMMNPESKYPKAFAAGCVKAGNHITMPGTPEDVADILDALEDEKHPYHLTMAELQEAAKGALRCHWKRCK